MLWVASPALPYWSSSAATPVWPSPGRFEASVFPAIQNLLLAAHALGLGSTLTTLPVLGGDELPSLLGLPPEVVPIAVVPLGRLPKPLGKPKRRPLSEKAHLDRYGTPFRPT